MSEFDKAREKALDNALNAMKESMFMIEADTKQLTPVKTGTLKRSYTSDAKLEGNTITGVVGSYVDYAYWADQRRPHLTQAVDSNMEAVKQKLADALSRG